MCMRHILQECSVVSLDMVFAIPTEFYAQMQPRSGLAAKDNIDVSAGVIHSDFRGNIGGLLVNNCSDKFVVSQEDHIAQVLSKPVARPVPQKVPALAQTTRGSPGFWSTGTGKVVDDDSSHDHKKPPMAAHSVCTCCRKGSSDHQAATICSLRANHGMTHDHLHVHGFIADRRTWQNMRCSYLPVVVGHRQPAPRSKWCVGSGRVQTRENGIPDVGYVRSALLGVVWLYREWIDKASETMARDDTVAGSQLTRVAMLSEPRSPEMTAKERLHRRRSLHKVKSDSRFSLLPLGKRRFLKWAQK